MAGLCESLITDQNSSPFKSYEPTTSLVQVDGLKEISVSHHKSALTASAVSDTDHWFLCLVAADPPIEAQEAEELIGAWSSYQYNLIKNSTAIAVIFSDEKTIEPVRVECKLENRIVVVLGFISDRGDFQVGVTNRLPSMVESPC
ncbi:hypothetical protein ACS3SW_20665 [Roseobacteraceae bacterium S113]